MSDNKPIGVIRAPVYPHYSMQLELYNSQKLQLPLEIYAKPETSPDSNVERNRQLLLDRSKVGLQKYGTTTDRTDLTVTQWVQHLIEELLDAANYAQKLSTLLPQIFIDPNSPARQTFNDGAPSNVAPVVNEAENKIPYPLTSHLRDIIQSQKEQLSNDDDLIHELKTKIEKLANIESVIEEHKRLTKELDKIINGDGAATDPSLCDIVAQLRHYAQQAQPLALPITQPTQTPPQPKLASQNDTLNGLPITFNGTIVAKMGQPIDYNVVGSIVRLTSEQLKQNILCKMSEEVEDDNYIAYSDVIRIIKSL